MREGKKGSEIERVIGDREKERAKEGERERERERERKRDCRVKEILWTSKKRDNY